MKSAVLLKVVIAIVLAIVAGFIAGPESTIFGVPWVSIFNLIGQLFLSALTLVVVPLVVSSIITGVSRIGQEESFGSLGLQTFFYFVLTSFLAVLLGVVIVMLIAPGASFDTSVLTSQVDAAPLGALEEYASDGVFDKFEQILFRLIPSNILAVASQGQMLGLIFFSLLFGFFSTRIEANLSKIMISFWNGVFQIMMQMTHLVMRALPVGVFGLTAKVVATTGLETIKPVVLFFFTAVLALAIYMFIVLPLLLKLVRGINPIKHFRAVGPALITAFTTSSTAATLPITMECMEKRAGVPNRICSFILPLGTTINLTGTAIYATIAVIFIAQAYGLEMTPPILFTIILMGMFTALGMVAGIPSGSLITIVVILQTIGLPPDGIVLILAVERILDMVRTTVSVFGNTCCTALVRYEELQ
ncbi:MAG: Proton glutamate symport protein [Chlamydiae bacterium]|nr:Proton glutamate symport protein [Chlamydiota bacterium]